MLAFGARSPNAQWTVVVASEHPATGVANDQLMPGPVGTLSSSMTLVALPRPILLTVRTYPIGSPAFTLAASAVLLITKPGHRIVIGAVACTGPLFVADAVAVLLIVPQIPTVGEVIWTCALVIGAMSPNVQVSVVRRITQ